MDALELYYSHAWTLSNKLCIQSVVRVGPPLHVVVLEVSSEALKWWSVVSVRSQVSCCVPQGLLDTSPTGFVLTVLHIIMKSCGRRSAGCVYCGLFFVM